MRVLAIGRVRGSRLRGNGHNHRPQFGVRRQHPMKADEMQRGRGTRVASRYMNSSGDMTMWLVPSR